MITTNTDTARKALQMIWSGAKGPILAFGPFRAKIVDYGDSQNMAIVADDNGYRMCELSRLEGFVYRSYTDGDELLLEKGLALYEEATR